MAPGTAKARSGGGGSLWPPNAATRSHDPSPWLQAMQATGPQISGTVKCYSNEAAQIAYTILEALDYTITEVHDVGDYITIQYEKEKQP